MGRSGKGTMNSSSDIDIKATIPKTQEAKEDGKPFTFYMLHVEVPRQDTMVVPRRFRDFDQLRTDLLQEFPAIFDTKQNPDAPQLPAKQLFGNMSPDVISKRRVELEKFITVCLSFKEVVESDKFGKFLQLG